MATFSGFPRDSYAFSADEVGRALAGLVRRDGAGLPVPGVLGDGPKVTTVGSSWKVEVSPFMFVQRVAEAVRFSGVSTPEQVDIGTAATIPAGQSRIDLIVWDADAAALVVIPGVPAVTPAVPSDGGMAAVATVRVKAGDGMVIAGQIATVFTRTGLAGGERVDKGVIAARSVGKYSGTSVQVTFEAGRFSAPPNVQATINGPSVHATLSVTNVTATGCTVWLRNDHSAAASFGAFWRAEQ